MFYKKEELIRLVINGGSPMMVEITSCLTKELHVKTVDEEKPVKTLKEAVDPDADNADFTQFLKRNGLA